MMENPALEPQLTSELIQKYDLRVPRYTSYPTVPNWQNDYTYQDHLDALEQGNSSKDPISIYLHIPFCIRRCLFCACNVIVTRRKDRVEHYLDSLIKEIQHTASVLGERKDAIQLHLGGGTPTHLSPGQMERLFSVIHDLFRFDPKSEKSIEVHPSVTSTQHLDVLSDFGFNRLSIGVQDFDPQVQENLKRHQTFEETRDLITYGREQTSFESINLDIIYGLPYQSKQGLSDTIDQVFDLRADRVALYSYAHFPSIFPHHKVAPIEVIPQGTDKLDLFLLAREKFLNYGYRQIGFDHFALPDDELWKSYENRTLRRNFMGYTTKQGTDLIGFGYSAISELSGSYAQNSKDLDEYHQMIDKHGTAVIKGTKMSKDDIMRKEVIMGILCQGQLDYSALRGKYLQVEEIIDTAEKRFPEFEKIGFVRKVERGWETTPTGNIFGRILASNFDTSYDTTKHLFSKSV